MSLRELMPFLIPLAIAFTMWHILTHDRYKRGNRAIWIIVAIAGMQFIGPVLYFLLGKEDN